MPVFFFIDPDFLKDAAMSNVNHIVLSYTFFMTNDSDEVEEALATKALPAGNIKTVLSK